MTAATSIALSGTCGVELGKLPLEKIGCGVDIAAGVMFVVSKKIHGKVAH